MGEQSAIDKVGAEIAALNVKLEKLEAEIEKVRAAGDKEELAALREDKKQLAIEKMQLREKELVLLKRGEKGDHCTPYRAAAVPTKTRLTHRSFAGRGGLVGSLERNSI